MLHTILSACHSLYPFSWKRFLEPLGPERRLPPPGLWGAWAWPHGLSMADGVADGKRASEQKRLLATHEPPLLSFAYATERPPSIKSACSPVQGSTPHLTRPPGLATGFPGGWGGLVVEEAM